MNEGIEYAEMLEIPVNTVNVVQPKRRRLQDLKLLAVGRVNKRMQAHARERDANFLGNDPVESDRETPYAAAGAEEGAATVAEEGFVAENAPSGRKFDLRKLRVNTHPVLIAEFAAACVLCVVIFLTNVFMSNSAINTFLRSVIHGGEEASVSKTYSDFTLSPVVSEYSSVTTSVSSAGVLSFQGECSVYPACDGKVGTMSEKDGLYTVVVNHSDTFRSVYTGLTRVYYEEGGEVKANVPFAYTDGKTKVQVSFYQDGKMLDCYAVDAQNCLSWKK